MTLPRLSDVDPALLTRIGAAAMHALMSYGWLEQRLPERARVTAERAQAARPTRKHVRTSATPRTYASQYKGVSVYRERWYVSHWTTLGKPRTGRMRERTERGEKWAAQDRARGLGLDYLEMRDGTRAAYVWDTMEDV